MILASPTEPKAIISGLRAQTSSTPEKYGVDFLWETKHGLAGVQRKQFPGDFLSSVADGRLAKEMLQITQIPLRMLLVEGRPNFTVDGYLIYSPNHKVHESIRRRITKSQIRHTFWNIINSHDVILQRTTDHEDTIATIRDWHMWTSMEDHGQCVRPTSKVNTLAYLLQGIPTIGPKTVKLILDFIPTPLDWTIDPAHIPGLEKHQIKEMRSALEA